MKYLLFSVDQIQPEEFNSLTELQEHIQIRLDDGCFSEDEIVVVYGITLKVSVIKTPKVFIEEA